MDPRVIPLGTHVRIQGKEYRADDTGGAVKGHVVDIFMYPTKKNPDACVAAVNWGRRNVMLEIIE